MDAILPHVTQFLGLLNLSLSHPQSRQLARLVQALLVFEGHKTLARLSRLCPGTRSRSAAADFLSSSAWSNHQVMASLCELFFELVLAIHRRTPARLKKHLRLLLLIDDTLLKKPKASRGFEAADWVWDHCHGRSAWGMVLVNLVVSFGPLSFAPAWRLYLRKNTLRRLRREGADSRRLYGVHPALRFRSKIALARELLEEMRPYTKKLREVGIAIVVVFDSWYASRSLINYCRRQGWQVVCGIKSNRKLSGKTLTQLARTPGKRRTLVEVESSAGQHTRYWVRAFEGLVEGVGQTCRVVISRGTGRRAPVFYLLTTDLTLSLQEVMQIYSGRWRVELLHWDLKVKLGLEDFRVRNLEGLLRWITVEFLAVNLIRWMSVQQREGSGEVLSRLRRERAEMLLRDAVRRAKKGTRPKTILSRILPLLS